MSKHLIPTLNYKQAASAVAACLRAKRAGMLVGSPGVGKTSLVRDASDAIQKTCYDLIASNMDPTDVAGLPFRDPETGRVLRELFPEIRAVVDGPGVLFLDEATTMPKSVEGPLLRLALERNAGGMPLHPDSAVLLACNPPEQAPGGIELSAAMVNRVVVMKYQPGFDEVQSYFNGEPVRAEPLVLSEEAFHKACAAEFADFAATLAHATDLIVYDPPRASIDQGEPWASPRGWEIGLSCLAAHGGLEDEVGFALLAGSVGPAAGGSYLAIRKLRVHLPSIDEIKSNPTKANVPRQDDQQIAALGVLARVAQDDVWAAWTYAARMKPEIGAAAGRVLMNKVPQRSPHAKSGKKAQVDLLAKVKRHSA
jgi:hypothetical protein